MFGVAGGVTPGSKANEVNLLMARKIKMMGKGSRTAPAHRSRKLHGKGLKVHQGGVVGLLGKNLSLEGWSGGNRLPKAVWSPHPWMWHLGTWLVGNMGLRGLTGLFQPEWFHESVTCSLLWGGSPHKLSPNGHESDVEVNHPS